MSFASLDCQGEPGHLLWPPEGPVLLLCSLDLASFLLCSSPMDWPVLSLLFWAAQWENSHGPFGQSPMLQPISETWSAHKGARAQGVKDFSPGGDIGYGKRHNEDQYSDTE